MADLLLYPPTNKAAILRRKKKVFGGVKIGKILARSALKVRTTSSSTTALHPLIPKRTRQDQLARSQSSLAHQVFTKQVALPSLLSPVNVSTRNSTDFIQGASSAAVRPAVNSSGHTNSERGQEHQQHWYWYRMKSGERAPNQERFKFHDPCTALCHIVRNQLTINRSGTTVNMFPRLLTMTWR